MKPADGYEPRFSYNGYLKNRTWVSFDEQPKQSITSEQQDQQRQYAQRRKSKHCLLMAFAGDNYYGMQYNKTMNTIEKHLFEAMIRHGYMLTEHLEQLYRVKFVHGSLTDRGVSALRMTCSMILRERNPFISSVDNHQTSVYTQRQESLANSCSFCNKLHQPTTWMLTY